MDATPEQFAYRCLPLNIANMHGWEVLCPVDFEAVWTGGLSTRDVLFRFPPGAETDEMRPVSIFGQGVLTFHIAGLFRTPPGWNLWVGGSPNSFKHGIQALNGIVETDWSPYTFTMNWRFTGPRVPVRFVKGEPICFLFPLQTGAIEAFEPRYEPMDAEPDLAETFAAWSRSRDAFQAWVAKEQPVNPTDRWQKHYYRGVYPDERPTEGEHRTKLRLKPFR
jgi:hypothetical protein